MEVFYCDKCGTRINQADLEDGKAVFDGGVAHCPRCVPSGSSPRGRPFLRARPETSRHGRKASRWPSRGSAGLAVVVVAVVVYSRAGRGVQPAARAEFSAAEESSARTRLGEHPYARGEFRQRGHREASPAQEALDARCRSLG